MNSWQSTSARPRFYRVLMGKYFQAALYIHPEASSDLLWQQNLSSRDAGSQMGLAKPRHWFNCLNRLASAVIALVSGICFC